MNTLVTPVENALAPLVARARREGSNVLLEHEGYDLLDAVGVRTPRRHVVSSSAEAAPADLARLAGLIPADRGDVMVNGQKVTAPGGDRCMVFQQFGLLPWRTVVSNVEFGLEIEGVPKDERRRAAEKYLNLVGLKGFEHYYPHQISGGMQQRVGIARALSKHPDILLMDEPFGAVDAQTREQLQEELLKIWNQTDTTVIFVTHSIDEAIYLSDRVVVMQARPGRIKEEVIVDLPRPRWEGDVKALPRFAQLRTQLRESLRG